MALHLRSRDRDARSTSRRSNTPTENSLSPARPPRFSHPKAESDTEENRDKSRKGSDDSTQRGSNDSSQKKRHVPAIFKIFIHPPEFKHELFEDKSLENFHAEIKGMKVDAEKEFDEKGKLHKFNNALKTIEEYGVDKLIEDRKKAIKELAKLNTDQEKKEKLDAVKVTEVKCIEESRDKIEAERKKLIRRTQQELYEQIQTIVVSPTWEAQVKKCGGNVILNEEDKKVHVPTGIEKMNRILADDVLPFRKRCCRFRFFCPPTPVSRSAANRKIKLESSVIVQLIIDMKSVAIERLGSGKKKKKLTDEFYSTLREIDADLLSDFLTLQIYIKKMEWINKALAINDFITEDDNEDPDSTTALRRMISSL